MSSSSSSSGRNSVTKAAAGTSHIRNHNGRQAHLLSLMPLSKRTYDANSTFLSARFVTSLSLSVARPGNISSNATGPCLPDQLRDCDVPIKLETVSGNSKRPFQNSHSSGQRSPTFLCYSRYYHFSHCRTLGHFRASLQHSTPIRSLHQSFSGPTLQAPFPPIEEMPGPYWKSLGVTHAASLFQQDEWGRNYHRVLQQECVVQGVDLVSWSFQAGLDNKAFRHAAVAASQRRYILLMDFCTLL